MSDIFTIYKNSYLQTRSSSVNPRIINRCVNLARSKRFSTDSADFEPPWHRLTSEQPDIPSPNVDVTKRPVAFGNLALPILRRQIHDKDDVVVISALLSIADLVHDPEKAYEAIDLKIPDRLSDKLLDGQPAIREAATLIFSILAEFADGKEAIIRNPDILENLCLSLGDAQISVRLKVAACFEMIARSWIAADVLVENELVQILLGIVAKDEVSNIIEFHLVTLKSLMYDCGKCIALKNNGFQIFMKYLEHENTSLVCKALDCLSILTSTKKGKQLAIQKNLLKTLNKLIYYSDNTVCEKTASVIMFCTIKTRAKFLAAEMKSLVRRLVKLSTNPINRTLQMFALKALTNVCEHPLIRKEVLEQYLGRLTNLEVDPENAVYKNILLQNINWLPYKWD